MLFRAMKFFIPFAERCDRLSWFTSVSQVNVHTWLSEDARSLRIYWLTVLPFGALADSVAKLAAGLTDQLSWVIPCNTLLPATQNSPQPCNFFPVLRNPKVPSRVYNSPRYISFWASSIQPTTYHANLLRCIPPLNFCPTCSSQAIISPSGFLS